MHNFFVCACKSQDLAQSQKKIARSHDRETVSFRNSEQELELGIHNSLLHGPRIKYLIEVHSSGNIYIIQENEGNIFLSVESDYCPMQSSILSNLSHGKGMLTFFKSFKTFSHLSVNSCKECMSLTKWYASLFFLYIQVINNMFLQP